MAELVDAADSKSASGDRVPVQVRMGAPFLLTTICCFFIAFFVCRVIIEFANHFQFGGVMTRGKYSTKQKEEIIQVISSMHCEFSIKDIYDQLSSTSLTTVYRLIDQLEKEGIIQKSIGVDGKTTYQYIEKCDCDHFYLKCDCCGKLTHVECGFVNELSNHIVKDHKFHLNKEHIIMKGICSECFQKEGN